MNDQINDGGTAFPCTVPNYGHGIRAEIQEGMSLRDWFAGMALQGYLSGRSNNMETALNYIPSRVGLDCYYYADAMLAARKGAQ